tara:strand:- start:328 stop:669 length:342 start_codon:yes stop_codon:yes gene_type:complete
MKNIFRISILIVFFVSCTNKEANIFIVPEDILIPMLCDFHILDAASKQGVISNNRNNLVRHSQYNSILLKYNIERSRFDSTIQYYTQRPIEYKALYEIVASKIINKLEQNQID